MVQLAMDIYTNKFYSSYQNDDDTVAMLEPFCQAGSQGSPQVKTKRFLGQFP